MTIDVARLMRETFVGRVEYRTVVDSTNNLAAQCASQAAGDLPLLVIADEQTAGRGRGGNRWWTGSGSLAFSLLLDAETVAAGENRSPLVALATAVAVVDAVAPLLPASRVGIYWPNDVYVHLPQLGASRGGDRKLAGILVEVLPNRRHVIGIGLNVDNSAADAPTELQGAVATLRDLAGHEFDRMQVLIDLLGCLERELSRLRTDGKQVAGRADSLCLQHGQTLTIDRGNQKLTGKCRGIAGDGAILLETSAGTERLVSGSVVSVIAGSVVSVIEKGPETMRRSVHRER
jgi:BirA family transcriptional regulator, biotin operon repressor / biotin---[acetyl-CoA-carboxylase] ligase